MGMANKVIQLKDGSDNLYPNEPMINKTSNNFFTQVSGVTIQTKSFLCTSRVAMLYLNLQKTDSTAWGWGRTNVGTLASGYRPLLGTGCSGCGSDAVNSYPNRNIYINVAADGSIFVDNFNNDTKSFYIRIVYLLA